MTDINKMVERLQEIVELEHGWVDMDGIPEFALSVALAIQDVLAVHEIEEDRYTLRQEGDDYYRQETCECMDDYPCETRQAIINRLGGME